MNISEQIQQIETAKADVKFDQVVQDQLRRRGRSVTVDAIRVEVNQRIVRAVLTSVRKETNLVKSLPMRGDRTFNRTTQLEVTIRDLVRLLREFQGKPASRAEERKQRTDLVVLVEAILQRILL